MEEVSPVPYRLPRATLTRPPLTPHRPSALTLARAVDGAIHSAAGPGLYEECKTIDGAETGETKITGGYNLPAKHVLHTVGPIYSRAKVERSEAALRSCYQGCLELAVENECRTIVSGQMNSLEVVKWGGG